MGKTAGDYLCERLIEWGVDTIYGFPGDGINGILGALRRHEDQLRFIQTRHEEMASFMACGYAKFTGEVGVCLATSGPGAIHLLNGLYDAKLDHRRWWPSWARPSLGPWAAISSKRSTSSSCIPT